MEGMTDKELITITIEQYASLQRIKSANGDTENKELEYQLKILIRIFGIVLIRCRVIKFTGLR